MARFINIAGAQLGGIARDESRRHVVERMIELFQDAHKRGAEVVVFPELALTSFFPRWWMTDQAEIDAFFETEMPNAATQPLFDAAKRLGIGFYLGYAELAQEGGATKHYNTSILVDRTGQIVGKYRKVHLPGHADHRPHMPYQHLEKHYFDVGDIGFEAGISRAANSEWRSATIAAGRKPTVSWPCRAPKWSCSATTRRRTFRGSRCMTT